MRKILFYLIFISALSNAQTTGKSCSECIPSTSGVPNDYVLTNNSGIPTWQSASGGGWSLTGNSGTIPGTNYVGTTDNNLIFKIYNVTAGMLDSTLLNTSYGQRALYSASGALNTALGYISLANNTSGTRNTAIGANSFATATTGSRNTGIGYGSANQLTTGSGNVVIGNRTARFLTTGNRNVVIGDSAQVGATTTNSIVLGANANGNLGDSTLVITNAIAHMHLLLNGGSNGDVLTTDGSGDATYKNLDSLLPYRKYVALLTQTDTSAPVATVLENTIGNIVWTRCAEGCYLGTLSGAFTTNKTGFTIQPPSNALCTGFFETDHVTTDEVAFTYARKTTGACDGVLDNTMIEIRVYK